MSDWYLTLPTRALWCDECSEPISKGTPFYFNYPTHTSLCQVCGGGMQARPSKRFLKAANERAAAAQPRLF